MRIPKVTKLRTVLLAVGLGLLGGVVALLSQEPPCSSAQVTCPVGNDREISGGLGIQSNTPYTATLTTTATADRTITLPDANDTLVTATSTDTFQNKIIDFSLNTGSNLDATGLSGSPLAAAIINSSLTSMGILLDLDIGSDLTTLTESATYGAGDVEIEGNVIYRDDGVTIPIPDGGTNAETLTLNGVIVNGSTALTGVSLASKGQIFVGDGSGLPQALAVGADGTMLMADPAEVTGVKWEPAGGGGATAMESWAWTACSAWWPGGFTGSIWVELGIQSTCNPADWGLYDADDEMGTKGTGFTQPAALSGVWAFPETGQWIVRASVRWWCQYFSYQCSNIRTKLSGTNNAGASWTVLTRDGFGSTCTGPCTPNHTVFFIFDVDDLSNDKIMYEIGSLQSGNNASEPYPWGSNSYWSQRLDFIRLGD